MWSKMFSKMALSLPVLSASTVFARAAVSALMELECKFSLQDLVFTFSVVVCVLTHPSLTLTAPLSLCGSCLWVMSCLVSWPLQLGAPPTLLAYHHSASVFLKNALSASSSLTLSPPSSHHRVIFCRFISFHLFSQLVPA